MRKPLLRSIRGQMIAAALASVATVIAVFLAIAWVQVSALGDEQAAARGQAVDGANRRAAHSLCRSTAVASAAALLEGGYSYIQNLVDTADDSNPDVAFVVISDDSGQVVADSRKAADRVPSATLNDAISRALEAPATRNDVQVFSDPNNPSLKIFAVNITLDDGESIGHVRIGMRMDAAGRAANAARADAQSRVASVLQQSAVAAALLLLLGIGAAVVQATRLSRPIQVLSKTAQRIAEGHLDQSVEPAGATEIAQLGRNFNDMAHQIRGLLVEAGRKAALEKEVEIARAVQGALVPPSTLMRVGAVEVLGFFQPATQCGGDWWLSKQLDNGRVLILIGDVTGHGLPPALITAAAIGCAETLPTNVTAAEALTQIDRAVAKANKGDAGLFMMSCFAAILDPSCELVQFSNGGHTNPYVVTRKDDDWRLGSLLARGPLLGDEEPVVVQSTSGALMAGDILVLYTDGVNECYNESGEQWGERGLQRALAKVVGHARDCHGAPSLASARDFILEALRAFAGDAEQRDDITLVLVRMQPDAGAAAGSLESAAAG